MFHHSNTCAPHRTKRAVGALAATAVLAMAGSPAGATVVETGRYATSYSFGYDDCGFPVEVTGRLSGSYGIREGKGKEASAFFLRERFSYSEIQTNTDTGEWFLLRGQGVYNELEANRVEGTIFEFVSVEAGQPFVIEDSDGNVVLRDRGSIRKRTLVDTFGDDEPGGSEVEFLGAEVRGPHPGFYIDFCEIAGGLIGS